MKLKLALAAVTLVAAGVLWQEVQLRREARGRSAAVPSRRVPPATPPPRPGPRSSSLDRQTSRIWYQYNDASGSVHFVPRLELVPPLWRSQAGRIEIAEPVETVVRRRGSPEAERITPDGISRPGAHLADGGTGGEIIVYTKAHCDYCKRAIAHLYRVNASYIEIDVEADPEAKEEYLRKAGGRPRLPLIDVDGQILRGYDPDELNAALARPE